MRLELHTNEAVKVERAKNVRANFRGLVLAGAKVLAGASQTQSTHRSLTAAAATADKARPLPESRPRAQATRDQKPTPWLSSTRRTHQQQGGDRIE
jgi:hypothetical protein